MNGIASTLPWLQHSWSLLENYIVQQRIPQALLVTGLKGLGKRQLVDQFVRVLLCDSKLPDNMACGSCQSCLLIKANTHPDFIYIEPEEAGKVIGVDVIRQLIRKMALKPQFEQSRMVVINQAESLNNASANAFLKFLEEPTERTNLVLITDSPARLSATIRSRCQQLPVIGPERSDLIDWLEQQGISEQTDLLASLSQGSPLLAKQLFENKVLQLRTECYENWLKVTKNSDHFVEIAAQWQKLDKSEMDLLLFWIISWVIDMVKLAYNHSPANLYNQDLSKDLQELAQKLDLKEIFKYYDFLLLTQSKIKGQLNKQLVFEEILIQWAMLNNR